MPGSDLYAILAKPWSSGQAQQAEVLNREIENRHRQLMAGPVQKWPHTFLRDDNGTCSSCGQEQYHDLRDNRICWVAYKSNPSK